jgi:hypothetical protein
MNKTDTMKIEISGIIYEIGKRIEEIWVKPEDWDENRGS